MGDETPWIDQISNIKSQNNKAKSKMSYAAHSAPEARPHAVLGVLAASPARAGAAGIAEGILHFDMSF
jgi:hypothetical protein